MPTKNMKTDIRFFIFLFLIVVSITCSVDVSAAPEGIPYEKNICRGVREELSGGAAFNMNIPDKMLQGGKIVKVTSSKKNVVKHIEISSEKKSFQFVTRKYGKTTFTITVKTAKNKNIYFFITIICLFLYWIFLFHHKHAPVLQQGQGKGNRAVLLFE